MVEMVLPGTYIEVRPEGLIVPGPVTVGNLGVVGTASKGPLNQPVILGSYTEARERFGDYDPWVNGNSNELTLVRALELAYSHGATTVYAVRISDKLANGTPVAAPAEYILRSPGGDAVSLTAKTPGTWGNKISINVWNAQENAVIEAEKHNGGAAITLSRTPVVKSSRNRIQLYTDANGLTRSLGIIYDDTAAAPNANQVKINRASGALTFAAGAEPEAADRIKAFYLVAASSARQVSLRYGSIQEVYTIVDGNDLVSDINLTSALVTAEALANANERPDNSLNAQAFALFSGGSNGETADAGDYKEGLDNLLNEDVQIVLAAGQDDSFGDELDAHAQVASSDSIRRERIAVVGSALGVTIDTILGHAQASDRVIFVAPGIKTTDAASGKEVTLPGSYAAAAVAGLLAGLSAHISPTNKTLRVGGLEQRYTNAELTQLVKARVLALEARQGFRIVKGITSATNTAWQQITTRRIVDLAKFGVRSAANPFIGLLNNDRVRTALRTAINTFLGNMVEDEMLISYELDVSATREEQRQGIARVTIVLRPVFSIDYIKVTMFLE
jgi:predicted RecA/RadA family phage recombinase